MLQSQPAAGAPALYGRESAAGRLLIHVTGSQHEAALRLLQSGDLRVDDCDAEGNTALHLACQVGDVAAAEFLLACGAAVNRENIDGGTPLCDAAASGCAGLVRLLLDSGAWVAPRFAFTGPAHEAAAAGHAIALQLLVNRGAPLDKLDGHLGSPLHYAAWHGRPAAALVLARSGASVDVPCRHATPLHAAARRGRADVARVLLAFGADPRLQDSGGRRPSQLAPPGTDCADLLAEAEAEASTEPPSLRRLSRRAMWQRCHAVSNSGAAAAALLRCLPPSLASYACCGLADVPTVE